MTFSIWPGVRTSDQTCSWTNTPSYCTRQARATLDTVSPVESETRWTWNFRFATAFSTPQRPREKCRIGRGNAGTGGAALRTAPIQDTTRPAPPFFVLCGQAGRNTLRIGNPAVKALQTGVGPSTAPWGR